MRPTAHPLPSPLSHTSQRENDISLGGGGAADDTTVAPGQGQSRRFSLSLLPLSSMKRYDTNLSELHMYTPTLAPTYRGPH